MKIPNRLLISVRNDFADLSRQLVVADYVERNEDLMLAEYIRVHVEMQARGPKKKPLERQLNLQRQLMRANSNCYPWENFLSLRLFPSKQVEWASKLSKMNCEVFPPASESELKATESDLGFKIPIVYREFLKRVANGVRYRSTDKAWEFDLFPANALGKSLGGRFRKDGLRRNRPTLKYGDPTGLTPISWDQLRGELPFSSNEFRQMDGMLL
ncbi:MAG: SMI1/KNR4 family protein, partial [Planctomycetota bacterium]